jgi:hypothetical protein
MHYDLNKILLVKQYEFWSIIKVSSQDEEK